MAIRRSRLASVASSKSARISGATPALFTSRSIHPKVGTVLAELFPTNVRYTGSSLTYNLAGIVGASLAPYAAQWLATTYGLHYVGYYLSTAAALSLIGLIVSRETRDTVL